MKTHDHFYAQRMRVNFAFLIVFGLLVAVSLFVDSQPEAPQPVTKVECKQ